MRFGTISIKCSYAVSYGKLSAIYGTCTGVLLEGYVACFVAWDVVNGNIIGETKTEGCNVAFFYSFSIDGEACDMRVALEGDVVGRGLDTTDINSAISDVIAGV